MHKQPYPVQRIPKPRFGEKKGVDTSLEITGPIAASTNTNGDAFTLNLPGQGTGYFQRIGRKIYMRSLRLRGQAVYIAGVTSTTNPSECLRMVVVLDKTPSGSLPTFATVFGTTIQDGTEASTVEAPVRFDNQDRFKILRDIHILPKGRTATVIPTTCQWSVPFDEYIKLNNIPTTYTTSTSNPTIADIATNAIYVYFRTRAATNDTQDWSISSISFARLRYTD